MQSYEQRHRRRERQGERPRKLGTHKSMESEQVTRSSKQNADIAAPTLFVFHRHIRMQSERTSERQIEQPNDRLKLLFIALKLLNVLGMIYYLCKQWAETKSSKSLYNLSLLANMITQHSFFFSPVWAIVFMVSKRVNERNKAQHLYNEWTYEAKKKKKTKQRETLQQSPMRKS